jgi:hypothetical protein
MFDAVNRSAPVNTTMTNPMGNTRAPVTLINPGAFSWNHGAVLATKDAAPPKLRRQPAEMAERNTRSARMFPFFTPALETSSMASAGVYGTMLTTFTKVGLTMFRVSDFSGERISTHEVK